MITETAVTSDSVVIHAPAAFVWDILVDFESYKDWNSFCPSIKNGALAIGEAVDMQVDLGHGLQQQVEHIEIIDKPNTLAWGMVLENPETLKALRTQTLKVIDEERCEYLSVDEFSGSLTAAVIEGTGEAIESGFNRCAYELKAYAEKCFQQVSAMNVSD